MEVVNIFFESGKEIKGKFGFIFIGSNKNEVNVFVPKNNGHKEILTSQALANILYNIHEGLYQINPKLVASYGTKKNCFYLATRNLIINDINDQNIGFWFFVQGTMLKVQISLEEKAEFKLFYNKYKEEINKVMNANEEIVKNVLDGINNPDRSIRNKITLTDISANSKWINFNLVNTEPLPLLFEYFKRLRIISP